MKTIYDDEFGEISVRFNAWSVGVRISVAPNGRLRISAPIHTSAHIIKKNLNTMRTNIRQLLIDQTPNIIYKHGQSIGKSHTIAVIPTQMVDQPTLKIKQQKLLVYLPPTYQTTDSHIQRLIRDYIVIILRREAKAYLPRRLQRLAQREGFSYRRIRFSHASSRWGSCSNEQTISLNIALMKLPHELIDYVLIHELCHTKYMNHSPAFWRLVSRCDSKYQLHRRQLQHETPTI